MIVVSNTSPIINLAAIGQLDLLQNLLGFPLDSFGHRKPLRYVIIYRQMKLIPLTSTTYIFWVRPEHRATVERYLLAAG